MGASTWTVFADGSGDYPTLQEAIEGAASGDSILVGRGEHRGPFWIESKNVILRSLEGPEDTILRGSPDLGEGWQPVVHFFYEAQSGSAIEGFTIEHGESGIRCTSASPVIRGNIIRDNSGPAGSGISCNFGSAPAIEQNLIWRNRAVFGCCSPSHGAGIYADDTSPAVIRGNVVAYNQCAGQCAGGGLSVFGGTIEGNTIFGNWADGPAGGVELIGTGVRLAGNIIVGNRSKEYADGIMVLHPAEIRCNDIWNNGDEDYWGAGPGEGDFSADPRFCAVPSTSAEVLATLDAESFDLRSDSPCLPAHHPDGADCGLVGARPEGCAREMKPSAFTAPAPRPRVQVFPNPSRGGVGIRLSDPRTASRVTRLEIIDASGRVLQRLGPNANGGFHWDGRSTTGEPVTAGIYFARVHSEESYPCLGTILVVR